MGERSQASIDLQTLSDASLRVEVQRGNEAARALLLSRRLASLSIVLSGMDVGSDFAEARLSPDSFQEVHVRLDIIDTVLGDLDGGRFAESAPSSDRGLAALRSILEHGDDHSGAEPSAQAGTQSDEDEQSWRAFLGPLLPKEEAARRLGLASEAEIDEWVADGRILALPISNGEMAFPAFQIRPNGAVFSIIEPVIAIFQNVVATPYTIASWLRGPKDYLDGKSPMQWLELGGGSEPVIAGAERAAAQLVQ